MQANSGSRMSAYQSRLGKCKKTAKRRSLPAISSGGPPQYLTGQGLAAATGISYDLVLPTLEELTP